MSLPKERIDQWHAKGMALDWCNCPVREMTKDELVAYAGYLHTFWQDLMIAHAQSKRLGKRTKGG